MITLFDGNRTERYTFLVSAAAAAKDWYSKLAGKKLPKWHYRIQTFDDFAEAIDDFTCTACCERGLFTEPKV